jgi:glycine/D-amino acid oxidase-like deaminating enzyme
MKQHDVIIVGAGIIGLSIAWQLARRSQLSILVLEKGAGLGEGSTGASSAVCRHRYSRDSMVELARDGIALYRDWQTFTGLSAPRAGFHNDGVLWLAGADTEWAGREQQRMGQFGIRCEVLDDAELCRRFPGYNPCVLAPDLETGAPHDCRGGGSHLLELDGGYMDPVLAAEDLREACLAAGVAVRMNVRVQDVDTRGGRVRGVTLEGGESLSAPLLVNAAGPWCRNLYEAAGVALDWDLAPIRIQIVYLDRPSAVEGHIPVTADFGSGIYFRTQNRGQQLVLGSVLEEDEREEVAEPDDFLREIDSDFEARKLHLLEHRLPGLAAHGKVRGYCGLYTMNRQDVHPILGESELPGFWVANGFSGHGFKLAPAIGSLMAQAITGDTMYGDCAVPIETYGIRREPIQLETLNVLA